MMTTLLKKFLIILYQKSFKFSLIANDLGCYINLSLNNALLGVLK